MSISELTRIVPPPESPREVGKAADWKRVEKELGTRLPSDYKEYVTRYGTGVLGGFIRIYNPFASARHFNLLIAAREVSEILRLAIQDRIDLSEAEYPFEVFPSERGLLPCGRDGNGNSITWLTEGKPDKWPIVLIEARDVEEYEKFSCSLTTFLARAFQKKLRTSIWPDNFPDAYKPFSFEVYQPETKRRKPRSKKASSSREE